MTRHALALQRAIHFLHMLPRQVNVLFLSRRNTVRSILAQACLNFLGKRRFRAFSCGMPGFIGSSPDGLALGALASARIPGQGLVCTAWDRFTRNDSPRMDWVINLAAEIEPEVPSWPGQPEAALWSYPALPSGSSEDQTMTQVLHTLYSLHRRLELLVNLPLGHADQAALRSDVRDLGYAG